MIAKHTPSAPFALALGLLAFALPAQSAPDDWKNETALISLQGAETVVRHPGSDTILYKDTDPQLAIEWGMANARHTVVLAGKYAVSDRIDVPRDGVTLIIDQGAEMSAKPETIFTSPTPGFRARNGTLHPFSVLIYNQKNNVRVLMFGTVSTKGFPVMFDGWNEKGDCGLQGGMLVNTGKVPDMYWLVDSKKVQAPLVTLTAGAAALSLEGCEDCHLGMIANVAAEPGAITDEAVDLNSRSSGITIERLIGERAKEIIDCNESHAVIQEMVSVGAPRKHPLTGESKLTGGANFYGIIGDSGKLQDVGFGQKPVKGVAVSGPRFTSRAPLNTRSLEVGTTTILKDAVSTRLIHEIPKLPDALPQFTVMTTVEVTLEGGGKKFYKKEVAIDLNEK
ncbi:MAG: hypothetical protein ACKV19_16255 [Verrucomicrobiales bacterium]